MKSARSEVIKAIKELTKNNNFITISSIAKKAKLSYPTAHKWIRILQLEGVIEVKRLGSLFSIRLKEDKKNGTKDI